MVIKFQTKVKIKKCELIFSNFLPQWREMKNGKFVLTDFFLIIFNYFIILIAVIDLQQTLNFIESIDVKRK